MDSRSGCQYSNNKALIALLYLTAFAVVCPFTSVSAGKHDDHKKEFVPVANVVTTPQHPIYSCPHGFEQEGGHKDGGLRCWRETKAPARPFCRVGELNGEFCQLLEPIEYTCPPGYVPSGDKKVQRRHSHGHHGGKEEAITCVRIDSAPYERYCPNGLPLSPEGCISTQSASVWMICPTDTTKKHQERSDCHEYVSVPPILKCKPGLYLEGGVCIAHEQVPCGSPYVAAPTTACIGAGCTGHGKGSGVNGIPSLVRRLGKHDGKHDSELPLPAAIPAKVATETVVVKEVVQQFCDVRVEAAAFEVCPPNSQETTREKRHSGSPLNCVVAQHIPLQPYCPLPHGRIDPGGLTCSSEIIEEPLSQCPFGYTPCSEKKHHFHKSNGDCCRVDIVPPVPVCNKGFDIRGLNCAALYPVEFSCPNAGKFDHVTKKCFGREYIAPEVQYGVEVVTTPIAPPPPPFVGKASGVGHDHY